MPSKKGAAKPARRGTAGESGGRRLPPPRGRSALDPKLGILSEEFLLGLIRVKIEQGPGASAVLFHSVRYGEIRRDHGTEVAEHLMVRLGDLLRQTLRHDERLGRFGGDNIVLALPSGLPAAQETAARLHAIVRENSSFPVATGVAHSAGLKGGPAALCELALRAAIESGGSSVGARTAAGPVAAPHIPPPPPQGPDPFSAALEARYQRLVLLNRMSLELFSERPFREALHSCGGIIMALMGARFVGIHFLDDLGRPAPAFRSGDPHFSEPDAKRAEEALLSRTLRERKVIADDGAGLGWVATPLLAFPSSGPSEDGIVMVGYVDPQPESPVRDQTLVEIARLIRNARLIQRNLQQQRTMAAVTEQSADAIVLADLESRIVGWNPSATALFLYAGEEVLGESANLLIPEDRREELKKRDVERDMRRAMG